MGHFRIVKLIKLRMNKQRSRKHLRAADMFYHRGSMLL